MSPSYNPRALCYARRIFCPIVILFVFFLGSPALSQDRNDLSQDRNDSHDSPAIITFYQKVISPIDGHRCPMTPSCSSYLNQAMKKHGLLMGWIMGMDRLVRCGRSEVNLSPTIWKNGRKYTHDPVENNDFWWSDK